jgi:hypothetical protein
VDQEPSLSSKSPTNNYMLYSFAAKDVYIDTHYMLKMNSTTALYMRTVMPIYNTYWEIHRKIPPWSSNHLTTHSSKVLCLDKHKFGEKTLNLGEKIPDKLALIC